MSGRLNRCNVEFAVIANSIDAKPTVTIAAIASQNCGTTPDTAIVVPNAIEKMPRRRTDGVG